MPIVNRCGLSFRPAVSTSRSPGIRGKTLFCMKNQRPPASLDAGGLQSMLVATCLRALPRPFAPRTVPGGARLVRTARRVDNSESHKHHLCTTNIFALLTSGSSNFGSHSPQLGLQLEVYDEASPKVPGRVGNNREYGSQPARDAFSVKQIDRSYGRGPGRGSRIASPNCCSTL